MKRVLIVDDDAWFAGSLKANLSSKFHVGIVGSATDIFPAIEKFQPDVILLDLVLSGVNATTFLNEFASYDDMSHVDIIVMSSVADSIKKDSLTSFGVKAFIDKSTLTADSLEELL